MKTTVIIAVLALVAVAGIGAFLLMGNGDEDGAIVLEGTVGDDGILSPDTERSIIESIGKESDPSNIEVRIISDNTDELSISSRLLKATKESGASMSFGVKGATVGMSSKVLSALDVGDMTFMIRKVGVPDAYPEMKGRPPQDQGRIAGKGRNTHDARGPRVEWNG